MAPVSVSGPSGRAVWISVFLLLIFIQLLIPYFCWNHFADLRPDTELKSSIFCFPPISLVAFALLAMLLALYGKDRVVFRFSLVCQAASSIFLLIGIAEFLLRNWISWSQEHMTFSFYIFVAVEIQLVIVTALTYVSWGRLTPDWK